MASFEYVAIHNETNKKKKGLLEADSERQVRQKLREQNFFPVDVKVTKSKQSQQGGGLLGPSLSVTELALITRQLSTLISSGLPLEECLIALVEQSEDKKTRRIISA